MSNRKNPVNAGNLVDYIMEYEGGNPTIQGFLDLFSYLIKTGQVWSLQGSYGRTARSLIEAGTISNSGEINSKKIGKYSLTDHIYTE